MGLINLLRAIRPKELTQADGCDFDLAVSANYSSSRKYKERKSLAEEIAKHGINVLCTVIGWPRDELFFHQDGTFDYVQKATIQDEWCRHEAYHGGKFLKGNEFILASDAMIESKRKETLKMLGIEHAVYLDLDDCFKELEGIAVSGCKFYSPSGLKHIDTLFNLGNYKKVLFAYDSPASSNLAKETAKKIGYDAVALPLEDASFASVGFVELGNHIAVDCRAKKTIKIIGGLGYNVIPSPMLMEETNKKGRSIRCICTEIPKCYDKLEFYPFKEDAHDFSMDARLSLFWNLEGHKLKSPDNYKRLY